MPEKIEVGSLKKLKKLLAKELVEQFKSSDKGIESLMEELERGECELWEIDGVIIRKVHTAFARVLSPEHPGCCLMEMEQYIASMDKIYSREKGCYPGNKFQLNETPLEYIIRELKEEVSLYEADYREIEFKGIIEEKRKFSSYPIPSIYIRHCFDVELHTGVAPSLPLKVRVANGNVNYFKWVKEKENLNFVT